MLTAYDDLAEFWVVISIVSSDCELLACLVSIVAREISWTGFFFDDIILIIFWAEKMLNFLSLTEFLMFDNGLFSKKKTFSS